MFQNNPDSGRGCFVYLFKNCIFEFRNSELKGWVYGCLERVFGLDHVEMTARHTFSPQEFEEASELIRLHPFFHSFLMGVAYYKPRIEEVIVEFKDAWNSFPLVPRDIFSLKPEAAKLQLIVLKWMFLKSLDLVRDAGVLKGDELQTCEKRIKARLTQTVNVLKKYFGFTDETIRGVAVTDPLIWQEVREEIVAGDDELMLWLTNLDWNKLPIPRQHIVAASANVPTRKVGTHGNELPVYMPINSGSPKGSPSSKRSSKAAKAEQDRQTRANMRGKDRSGEGKGNNQPRNKK